MKKFLTIFFMNLVLVLLQLSFFGELFEGAFTPNLVLAFGFALTFGSLANSAKVSVLIGGLLLDLLGFNLVGHSSTVIIACMIMYDFIRRNVSKNVLLSAAAVFLSSLVYDKLLGMSPSLFFVQSQISALVTLAISGIFYFLINNVLTYLTRSGYGFSE